MMTRSFVGIERACRLSGTCVILSLALLTGCNSGTPSAPSKSSNEAQALSGKAQLKERLEMMAQTGSGGSATSGMRQGIEELKKTEPALADGLLTDLKTLEKLTDPTAVKAAARKMADKLK